MPNGAQNLGSQLGQLIFGAPDDGKAYYQGQALGAQVADRMASARKNRADALIGEDRLDARQGINPDAMTTAGYAPDQAALLGSILRSNDVVDLSRLGDLQAPTAGRALADAADATRLGDITTANRQLALAQGKPLEATSISDGTAFNKYAAPDQPLVTTALGDAAIDLRHAQAGASNASAANSYAGARLHNVQADAGGFNPRSGGASPASLPGIGGNLGALGDQGGELHGEEYLKSLPIDMQDTIKQIVEGRYPVPTGRMAMSPQWREILRAANRVDPTLDAGNYPARAATRKDFTSGKGAAAQIQSLNTLAGHLAEASDMADVMNNTSIPLYNRAANALVSGVGDERVNNFNRAANTAGSEFATLLKGGVPSLEEIREQRETLSPNMSPAQLHGALATMASQVQARLDALQHRANQGLGAGAKSIQIITPAAQRAFDTIRERGGVKEHNMGDAAPAAAASPSAPAQGSYQVGQIIMHNGKPYRVTGGDPNDPDVEPVQ